MHGQCEKATAYAMAQKPHRNICSTTAWLTLAEGSVPSISPEIRHHIGHAAHIEWQRLGVEAHEIWFGALRQRRRIGRIDAGDHGGCMAGRKLATHHFRQIHAASRRIRLLRRDIQNAHTRHLSFEFESSYRDAKGSCASRPRIAQASPQKPKAQRFAKICRHASAMQGMIEP